MAAFWPEISALILVPTSLSSVEDSRRSGPDAGVERAPDFRREGEVDIIADRVELGGGGRRGQESEGRSQGLGIRGQNVRSKEDACGKVHGQMEKLATNFLFLT